MFLVPTYLISGIVQCAIIGELNAIDVVFECCTLCDCCKWYDMWLWDGEWLFGMFEIVMICDLTAMTKVHLYWI